MSLFAGNDPSRSLADNMSMFAQVYTPLAEQAQKAGIKLAFENCPLLSGTPPVAHNLAWCPAAWEAMFQAVPSPAMGLELDTGHFPMLGIDLLRAVRDFAPRIAHVHLKDCIVDGEALYRSGNLGGNHYRYATPGEGQIDFAAFFKTLSDVGYQGFATFDLRPTTQDLILRAASHIRQLSM